MLEKLAICVSLILVMLFFVAALFKGGNDDDFPGGMA